MTVVVQYGAELDGIAEPEVEVTVHGTEAVMVVSGTLGTGAALVPVPVGVGAVYPQVTLLGIAVMIAGFWGMYLAQMPAKYAIAFCISASEPQACTQPTTLLVKPSSLQ
jgi:hypothetical protein